MWYSMGKTYLIVSYAVWRKSKITKKVLKIIEKKTDMCAQVHQNHSFLTFHSNFTEQVLPFYRQFVQQCIQCTRVHALSSYPSLFLSFILSPFLHRWTIFVLP